MSLTREKDVLKRYAESYYGLVLEAHIIELYCDSTLNFLKDISNPFLIDPVTYKFALPAIVEQTDKKWFEKLVDAYEMPIDAVSPRILPSNLSKPVLERFVESVLDYQRGIAKRLQNITGLLAWLSEESISYKRSSFSPEYIIPPYFMIESINHTDYYQWLKTNKDIIDLAREKVNANEKLLAVIALGDEAFLSDEVLDQVLQVYSDLKIDGCALWISNFDEVTQAPEVLKRLINFAKKLKERKRIPLFNFYGGYFSLLLISKKLLDGVVQGITVAEHREPSTTGGFAIPRYYLPKLHLFTSHEIAGRLSMVSTLKCNCPICSKLGGFEDFTNMSVEDTMTHFMHNRVLEAKEVETKSLKDLVNSLAETYRFMADLQKKSGRKLIYYDHLKSWIDVLEES
jgi:hypothetical protein